MRLKVKTYTLKRARKLCKRLLKLKGFSKAQKHSYRITLRRIEKELELRKKEKT